MRRFVFAPRWMAGHVVAVAAVVTCAWLGLWQWDRAALSGSVQNLGYALQWPLFAVFFAVGWWRMLLLESRRLDELAGAAPDGAAPEPAGVPSAGAAPAAAVGPPGPVVPPPARPADPEILADPEDRQLAAYNRMLAQLAAADRQRHSQ